MASVDELWLIDFGDPFPGEPAFHRPALVIGPPETFGPAFPFVIVVPLTSTRRGLSLHVEIDPGPGTGLDVVSYAQCELVRSINRRRLVHRLGVASAEVSAAVRDVVGMLIAL
ncbi:MAG: type II toxin-antitoxin system PemK/MazF family toxin [Acidimicrobiia bacterium]